MLNPRQIQTDAHTANLTELLLKKLESYERSNKELKAMVCALSNPLDYAQLFTEKEAAALLSISQKNTYLLRKEGKIHYHQVGINIRYSLRDILEYEEGCRR
ncbi:MAG: helix-turn-helix domain-containing protein [Bacteroidota bacterium]|nr:helix-turn-helix domain-containing protein [Bacteroidota bacterium]